jgi:hypothetical protein
MSNHPEEPNPHEQPCAACGEETAIGSVFWSDRFEGTTPEGKRFFVCSECRKPVKQGHHYVDMSDPDVYMSMLAAAQFQFRNSSGAS